MGNGHPLLTPHPSASTPALPAETTPPAPAPAQLPLPGLVDDAVRRVGDLGLVALRGEAWGGLQFPVEALLEDRQRTLRQAHGPRLDVGVVVVVLHQQE